MSDWCYKGCDLVCALYIPVLPSSCFCPLLEKEKKGGRERSALSVGNLFFLFPFFCPRRLCGAVGARVEGGRLCVLILSCSVILLLLIEGNCVCVCVLGCVCVRLSVRVHTQSARACLNVHVCV